MEEIIWTAMYHLTFNVIFSFYPGFIIVKLYPFAWIFPSFEKNKCSEN